MGMLVKPPKNFSQRGLSLFEIRYWRIVNSLHKMWPFIFLEILQWRDFLSPSTSRNFRPMFTCSNHSSFKLNNPDHIETYTWSQIVGAIDEQKLSIISLSWHLFITVGKWECWWNQQKTFSQCWLPLFGIRYRRVVNSIHKKCSFTFFEISNGKISSLEISLEILDPKIQQTKMLVTCFKGLVFVFIWAGLAVFFSSEKK